MRPKMNKRFPLPYAGGCFAIGRRMAILAVSAVLFLAAISGCSKTTKPKDAKYSIYRGVRNTIYIYDADSLMLLDSISRGYYQYALAASPDGRYLYVVDAPDRYSYSRLEKVDLQTRQVVWSRSNRDLGGGLQLRFLADGKLVFMGNGVLHPDDGTLLRRIGDSLVTMYGPKSGSRVAAIQDSVIMIIDAATGEFSGRYVPRLSNGLALVTYYARLHPDGRRVLVIGLSGSAYYSWFVIGDLVTDRTLYEYSLALPDGEVGISDDGSVAVVTDPPEMLGLEQSLSVIDLDHLILVRKFTDILARESQVRFLPDNRHAVLSGRADGHSGAPLRVLDVQNMTYQTATLPQIDSPIAAGLDIGPRP